MKVIGIEANGSRGEKEINDKMTFVVSSNATIPVGEKRQCRIIAPFSGKIIGWNLLADTNSNVQVDVWKSTDGSNPILSNSITGPIKPLLANQLMNSGVELTDYDIDVVKGEMYQMAINSNNNAKMISLQLIIEL